MKKLTKILLILLMLNFTVHGQILRPGEKPEKEVKEKKEKEQEVEEKKKEQETPKTVIIDGEEYEVVKKKNKADTTKVKKTPQIKDQLIYAHLIPSHVYRSFEPGSYYTNREEEVPGFKLSYMLGVRSLLTPNFLLDLGFAYYVNGENYFYEDQDLDSSFFRTRNHNTLSVPIKLGYQFALKDFNIFIHLGAAPSMLVNQVERTEINVGNNEPINDRVVNKNNLNQFNVALLASIGAQYNFSENWGIQIMPEFRYNLLPSDINVSFEHRAWAVGFHVGLTFGK